MLSVGGAERFNVELADALRQFDVEADFFLLWQEGALAAEASDRGLQVHLGGAGGLDPFLVGRLPRAWLRLARLSKHYDVVMGGLVVESALAYFLTRLWRKPVVGQVHGDIAPDFAAMGPQGVFYRLLVRAALPGLAAVVGISRSSTADAVELGVEPARAHTVETGLSLSRLGRMVGDTSPIVKEARPWVVSVGRLQPQKGFDMLIRAHALAKQKVDHELVIVGEGPQKAELERLARQLGVEDTVRLTGMLLNPYPVLDRADVFALSSRFEGLPAVVLEALALARPVIAFDCVTGVHDSLGGGEFGLLLPPEDVEAMGEAIVSTLNNPEPLLKKAAIGRDHVIQHRSMSAVAEAYAKVLAEAVAVGRSRSHA